MANPRHCYALVFRQHGDLDALQCVPMKVLKALAHVRADHYETIGPDCRAQWLDWYKIPLGKGFNLDRVEAILDRVGVRVYLAGARVYHSATSIGFAPGFRAGLVRESIDYRTETGLLALAFGTEVSAWPKAIPLGEIDGAKLYADMDREDRFKAFRDRLVAYLLSEQQRGFDTDDQELIDRMGKAIERIDQKAKRERPIAGKADRKIAKLAEPMPAFAESDFMPSQEHGSGI